MSVEVCIRNGKTEFTDHATYRIYLIVVSMTGRNRKEEKKKKRKEKKAKERKCGMGGRKPFQF